MGNIKFRTPEATPREREPVAFPTVLQYECLGDGVLRGYLTSIGLLNAIITLENSTFSNQ
jgi:hypothetical protein